MRWLMAKKKLSHDGIRAVRFGRVVLAKHIEAGGEPGPLFLAFVGALAEIDAPLAIKVLKAAEAVVGDI